MKKRLSTIVLVLMLLLGVGLILYPTFANYWNERIYKHAIVNYDNVVSDSGADVTKELKKNALAYNSSIAVHGNNFGKLNESQKELYNQQLSLKGDDVSNMLGYLEIPSLNIDLPIYRGTSDVVLASGVGHLVGTSLPIGGISSHCVLSGHTGLPSAKLLTDLEEIKIGDKFYIKVLDERLAYEVDQILVVLPNDVSNLRIIDGMDLCTLVTCTPYGINSHRLLVRGHRIEEDAEAMIQDKKSNISLIIVIATVVIVCLLLIFIFYKKRKSKRDTIKVDSGDRT